VTKLKAELEDLRKKFKDDTMMTAPLKRARRILRGRNVRGNSAGRNTMTGFCLTLGNAALVYTYWLASSLFRSGPKKL